MVGWPASIYQAAMSGHHQMLPTTRPWVDAMRLGLLLSACGWGISFYFTFASWPVASIQLQEMGAEVIEYQPLLDYWLRMASSAFGCIGIGSALACARPPAFVGLIRLLGPFHFVVGTTLVIAAWRNHLSPALHPTFIPDIVFCFVAGSLIQLPLLHARRISRSAARSAAA